MISTLRWLSLVSPELDQLFKGSLLCDPCFLLVSVQAASPIQFTGLSGP